MAGFGWDGSAAQRNRELSLNHSNLKGGKEPPFLFYDRCMPKQVTIGARGEAQEKVEHRHTLTSHDKRLPPIYSTPDMIRLMETAGFHALQPFCEDGEITVGTAINIEHRASCGLGAEVHATAELESHNGKFYVLRVTATSGDREIGRGTITRAFVRPELVGTASD
jgi:fluoroacetyl-CoA thioesterase